MPKGTKSFAKRNKHALRIQEPLCSKVEGEELANAEDSGPVRSPLEQIQRDRHTARKASAEESSRARLRSPAAVASVEQTPEQTPGANAAGRDSPLSPICQWGRQRHPLFCT